MAESKRNLAASVRQRLLTVSQRRREPFDLILARYGVERLLYRLSQSTHADKFLLKGAMLFLVWTDAMHRPTRDVDLLGFGAADVDELKALFVELCGLSVEPDGLRFLSESVEAAPIREQASYPGVRVTLEARLENAKIAVQVDIGFGDAVTPSAAETSFPPLLDFPAPRLRAYPVYTVVAEKLEATVRLGEANTRLKDFFDLWFLSLKFDFEGGLLAQAILRTFARRQTKVPEMEPVALTNSFAVAKATTWNLFLRRNALPPVELSAVQEQIRSFALPVFRIILLNGDSSRAWTPTRGWYLP